MGEEERFKGSEVPVPEPKFISNSGVRAVARAFATTPPDWIKLLRLYHQRKFYINYKDDHGVKGVFFQLHADTVFDSNPQLQAVMQLAPRALHTPNYEFKRSNGVGFATEVFKNDRGVTDFDRLLIVKGDDGSAILLAIELKTLNTNMTTARTMLRQFYKHIASREKTHNPLSEFVKTYNRHFPDKPLSGYGCMLITTNNMAQHLSRSDSRKRFQESGGIVVCTPFSDETFGAKAQVRATQFHAMYQERRGREYRD